MRGDITLFSEGIQIYVPVYGTQEACQQIYGMFDILNLTYFAGRVHVAQRQAQQGGGDAGSGECDVGSWHSIRLPQSIR